MSGSQCCGYVRQEFQLKRFGCSEAHPARFSYSQWRVPLEVVLLYRFIVAAYCIFWLIYTSRYGAVVVLNDTEIPMFAFLTTWTYFVLTVYLLLHFLSCLLYACRRGGAMCGRLSSENHRHIFHELQVQPSLWASREYDTIPGTDPDEVFSDEMRTIKLSWLTKLIWILYNIASNACILITLAFWILLYPGMEMSGKELMINIQLHGITSVIIMIEICISAVPIRLLHFVYTLAYGLLYYLFSGIYYAVDHKHVLYPHVLDWSEPGNTVIVMVLAAFIALPLVQLFLFGIYKFRLFIYDKCNPEQL
ncbi:protein rolling stone-like [Mercenaria mercenaria]|uniref:protein rolling stone-like n=1 Tax=Mercenaria mercenaria TaxID=6596 RepID=UPI001E1D5507|nr:protein rolling stone-like [Mercenaria mercenaria]XP_053377213.1 protein rolling stone-like [Mercenaria mercenaria]